MTAANIKSSKKSSEGTNSPRALKTVYFAVPMLILLTLTAVIAYDLGERRTAEILLHSEYPAKQHYTHTTSNNYDTERSLRDQLNRLTNDYESACYRYQELYAAYDALYAQAGANSGQTKIVRPDSARGNAESCYR
jgi:hypothetical protein